MDLKPARAAVRPRVVSPATGETVLLEDVIPERGTVVLTGATGMGKSTALAHIAAIRPDARVHDRSSSIDTGSVAADTFAMAPWGRDEILEYAMARHRGSVASIMSRVATAGDLGITDGVPELLVIALDAMASDETMADFRSALRCAIARAVPDLRARSAVSRAAAGSVWGGDFVKSICDSRLVMELMGLNLERTVLLMRHLQLRRLLACERIARDLRRRQPCAYLTGGLTLELAREVAMHIARDPVALARIREQLACRGRAALHPVLATIMHASNRGWSPDQDHVRNLRGAHFAHAEWPRMRLLRARLDGAVLDYAVLHDAVLDSLHGRGVSLARADLHCASLRHARLPGANLRRADLSFVRAEASVFTGASAPDASFENAMLRDAWFNNADIVGARFVRADLCGADFAGAAVEGTDFSGANLKRAALRGLKLNRATMFGAVMTGADLAAACLADVDLPKAQLAGACLQRADLTDANLERADLRGALLNEARLAGVDLEGADLSKADLAAATFHLGTSRSGMLFKGPSEGSRSGFYTDEYHEQSFKRPEEVRVANLRGADLRGANIENVDFYRVDLRDALYTSEQEAHFRKCRAILDVRAHGLE